MKEKEKEKKKLLKEKEAQTRREQILAQFQMAGNCAIVVPHFAYFYRSSS